MAGNAAIDHALGCCFRISPAWLSIPPGPKSRLRFTCSSSLRDRLLLNTGGGGSSSAGREAFYQPFRPPPGVLESIVSPDEQLQIVRERRGQWYDYGKHIPGLMRSGYTPATLDEATGITGVEQNQIVVACQVRDTLVSTGMVERSLAFFDSGGAAVLYELRILSAQQRRVAAEFVIERAMDAKSARDLARALKDFDRRKRDFGWNFFSSHPGDCLAFWWYRQSKELKDAEREEALRKALEFATSDSSRGLISSMLGEKLSFEAVSSVEKSKAPAEELVRVVRLEYGETSGLVMLPVAEAEASSIKAAPCGGALGEGAFRIHRSSTAWTGWVPLPGWKPVLDAVSPITVFFPDARKMGLHRKGRRKIAEDSDEASQEVLLLVDKGSILLIKPGSIYLVAAKGGGLSIEAGSELPNDVEVLAEVILALSPPSGEQEQEDPVDWD